MSEPEAPFWERCPRCKSLGKIDQAQYDGKISIECTECGFHYTRTPDKRLTER